MTDSVGRCSCRRLTQYSRCLETVVQPSAVLDLRFQQAKGKQSVFAVVSSTATLSIFQFQPTQPQGTLVQVIRVVRIDNVGDDVLFLSCAWHPNIPDLIAVSTSLGAVYVMDLRQTQGPCLSVSVTPVLTHELEAWTVAFSPFTRMSEASEDNSGTIITLYSGGDDSSLLYTSCALDGDAPPTDTATWHAQYAACKLAGHEAGVTAILPVDIVDTSGGHIVVTGSYDDHIRVFSIMDPIDTGGGRRASCLADQDLGGGVWRLKLISRSYGDGKGRWRVRLLASCMHAGVRIVDVDCDVSGSCHISVVARFTEHESMNYGSDFRETLPLLCVSTSFYDRRLCLWELAHRQDSSMNNTEEEHVIGL